MTLTPAPTVAAATRPRPLTPRVRPPGPLTTPLPPGRREVAVQLAVDALAEARKAEVTRTRKVIADHGLSLEVARLRDRLTVLPTSELHRLLLATPGVPERLFLEAIRDQLEEEGHREEQAASAVKDSSVDDLTEALQRSLEQLSKNLGEVITKSMVNVVKDYTQLADSSAAAGGPS